MRNPLRIPGLALLSCVWLSIGLLAGSVITADAQTVAIKGSTGQQGFGWMFRSGGNCYAVLPAHVAGPLPQISLRSAAPVSVGLGEVIRPFWEGIDLALAVVRGSIEDRCVAQMEDLRPGARAQSARSGRLHRLTPAGEDAWVDIAITRRDYLTLEGRVTTPEARIYQGTSGAFLFSGATPIGMAITSDDPARAVFMRSEEILLNLSRFLSEQGAAFVAEATPTPVPQDAGFAVSVASFTAAPIDPALGPDNVLGEGLYAFAPQAGVEIVFKVEGEAPVPLSRLVLQGVSDGSFAAPRRILVMTDAGAAGTRYRTWFRGEVPADGMLDTGPRAPRPARWIKLVVLSQWGAGDMAISRVALR